MLISYILCVSLNVRKISQEEKTKTCGMIKLDTCVDQWLRVWTICVTWIKWLTLSGSQFSQLQAEIKNNNTCLLGSLWILNMMIMFTKPAYLGTWMLVSPWQVSAIFLSHFHGRKTWGSEQWNNLSWTSHTPRRKSETEQQMLQSTRILSRSENRSPSLPMECGKESGRNI